MSTAILYLVLAVIRPALGVVQLRIIAPDSIESAEFWEPRDPALAKSQRRLALAAKALGWAGFALAPTYVVLAVARALS